MFRDVVKTRCERVGFRHSQLQYHRGLPDPGSVLRLSTGVRRYCQGQVSEVQTCHGSQDVEQCRVPLDPWAAQCSHRCRGCDWRGKIGSTVLRLRDSLVSRGSTASLLGYRPVRFGRARLRDCAARSSAAKKNKKWSDSSWENPDRSLTCLPKTPSGTVLPGGESSKGRGSL